jgi:hypothetical protein
LLAALVVIAFPQVILGWEVFVVRDFGVFAYPLAYFQKQCLLAGEIPLWNPYSNCGEPFLAQWNTMALYPPDLLYLLLPLGWGLSLFCLLHLWFAGVGMYCLARRLTGDTLAASAAGIVFAFNGLSVSLLMWPSHIATLSWMPWVILAVTRAAREGGRLVVLAALAGALQMLAGGPETIALTWILAVALLFAVQTSVGQTLRWSVARRLGVIILLVAALAAAQLLPFLDLATHSHRQQGFSDARWATPCRGWANLLVPMAFGETGPDGLFFQHGQYWISSFYFGVGALWLAGLAAWRTRTRPVVVLLALACAGFLLSLGEHTPVYGWLQSLIPQLALVTHPVKWMILVVFCAPLLASAGLAGLRPRGSETPTQSPRATGPLLGFGAALLALIGFVLFWEWLSPMAKDNVAAAARNGLWRAALLAGVVGLVYLLCAKPTLRRERALSLLLLLTLWLDLWTHEPQPNPTVPPAVYQPDATRAQNAFNSEPALGGPRVMVSPSAERTFLQYRGPQVEKTFLAHRLGAIGNCNLLDHLPKVNGFFSLDPKEIHQVVDLLYSSPDEKYPRLEDFLSVGLATAPGEFTEWKARGSCLPLITAGQAPVFLDETYAARRLIQQDFDGARFVSLLPETRATILVTNQTNARIVAQRVDRRQVEAEVAADAPSLVVIAQSYYHWWRAEVDGRPVPLLKANYAFQAVQVSAGNHQVRLRYEDWGFRMGGLLSLSALLGCVAGWWYLRAR